MTVVRQRQYSKAQECMLSGRTKGMCCSPLPPPPPPPPTSRKLRSFHSSPRHSILINLVPRDFWVIFKTAILKDTQKALETRLGFLWSNLHFEKYPEGPGDEVGFTLYNSCNVTRMQQAGRVLAAITHGQLLNHITIRRVQFFRFAKRGTGENNKQKANTKYGMIFPSCRTALKHD